MAFARLILALSGAAVLVTACSTGPKSGTTTARNFNSRQAPTSFNTVPISTTEPNSASSRPDALAQANLINAGTDAAAVAATNGGDWASITLSALHSAGPNLTFTYGNSNAPTAVSVLVSPAGVSLADRSGTATCWYLAQLAAGGREFGVSLDSGCMARPLGNLPNKRSDSFPFKVAPS